MQNQIEIWKEYPLNYENVNFYRVEVSNFGRVRTFNKMRPEGGLIKGSLQQGYPIIRITLFKARLAAVTEKIEAYNELINFLEERKRDLVHESPFTAEMQIKVEDFTQQKLAVISKRKKYIKKTDQQRKIFVHFLVHRAVAELFLKKTENAEVVIHKDFKKDNNHVNNLAWVTQEEAFSRYSQNPYYRTQVYNNSVFGEQRRKSGNEKLTVENVLYIKEKLNQGKTLRELASHFKVSDMQIHRIKTGENWNRVKTLREIKREKNKK